MRVHSKSGALVMAYAEVSKLSRNGSAHATYAGSVSCPPDCPLFKVCYAKQYPTVFVARRVDAEAVGHTPVEIAREEANGIDMLPGNVFLRLHVYGDSTTEEGTRLIADACGRYLDRGGEAAFTFTHAHNVPREAWGRVNVLRSCERPSQVRRAWADGYAAAIVVPENAETKAAFVRKKKFTYRGLTVVPCPQQTGAAPDCQRCGLCWSEAFAPERETAMALMTHAGQKFAATAIIEKLVEDEVVTRC